LHQFVELLMCSRTVPLHCMSWYSVLGEDPLAFLRNQPQFMQMRHVIQQNPNLLPTILSQIRLSNPRLLQVSTSFSDKTQPV